jgi:hypothetical protein
MGASRRGREVRKAECSGKARVLDMNTQTLNPSPEASGMGAADLSLRRLALPHRRLPVPQLPRWAAPMKKKYRTINRILKCGLGLMICVLWTGCASQSYQVVHFPDQGTSVEDAKKGRIYLMRHTSSISIPSRTRLVIVYDGDQEIGTVGNFGFLCWEREPGQAVITFPPYRAPPFVLTIEKDKTYYIQVRLKPMVNAPGSPLEVTRVLDEATGRKELGSCKAPNVTE